MSWTLLRWTWQLDGPLFVGAPPAGALNRCRLYVPARAVWGALTAELARVEAQSRGFPGYRKIGQELHEDARFTYLYPADQDGVSWRAWLPEFERGEGLRWRSERRDIEAMPDSRFRRRILGSRPGTAIDPDSDSACDGSLRETECVQERWRTPSSTSSSATAMVGYVFLKEGTGLEDRIKSVDVLFVGGDTRYGLGRMRRVSMDEQNTLFGMRVTLDGPVPRVEGARILAHADVDRAVTRVCGDYEAIGGWDMATARSFHRVRGPLLTPGSCCLDEAAPKWEILADGTWKMTSTLQETQ